MTTEIPREIAEQHAADDPTLRTMLERGLPLNRDTWIGVAWGGAVPADWTAEHELEVPEIFRDPGPGLAPPRDDD